MSSAGNQTGFWSGLVDKFLGRNWANAIQRQEFGLIADWFATWFFTVGIFGLLLIGVSAGLSGKDTLGPETVAAISHAAPPTMASDKRSNNNTTAARNVAVPATEPLFSQKTPLESVLTRIGLAVRLFSLGLLLAAACACLGWVLGLLFGVPRPSQVSNTTSGGNPAGTSVGQINTNLMEISDWLTKTIVGVGLTQLTVLPKFLGDLAAQINRFGFQWGDYGQLAALTIILYFLPGGFWLGYVGTRTLLTGLLNSVCLPPNKVAAAAAPENLKIDADNKILPADANVRAIDAALLAAPLQSLQNQDDVVAWASAQARSGNNLAAAGDALENAFASDPNNIDIGRQLLKIYLASGQPAKAVGLARQLPDSPPKMLALLYDAPPTGFTDALTIGTKLASDPRYSGSASLHVWLACAYGQQYSWEMGHENAADLPGIEKRVESEVANALKLDPAMKSVLHNFWKPDPGSTENDLKDIPASNTTLTNLLGR